jgi:predicted ATPase/DNA-binding XRE family transcriptional regulator
MAAASGLSENRAQSCDEASETLPGFGGLLRELRLRAGFTQEELAERAQLSERAVRALERSQGRTPRLQTVRLLAEGLGLDEQTQSRFLASARSRHHGSPGAGSASPPRFLTPLIRRREEIAMVKLLLEDRRLVTLIGTGGVGKTRLAVAVSEQVAPDFDSVLFVELAALREPAHVAGAIATALAVREEAPSTLVDLIVGSLKPRRALLVLDNMEHLLAARDLVLRLLGACSDLSMLITSREALYVRGERVYTVGPLPLPERDVDIVRSPAVALFRERARDAGGEVAMDQETTGTVAQICRRLDGLPLAIELAAAWAPILTPTALLHRLTTHDLHLDHGAWDLPERQRTMDATIAWSYDLLDPGDQALLARVSVFADGCTVEAIEAVSPGIGPRDVDVLEGLASLRGKSLLTVQDQAGGHAPQPRFKMLETVREFAYARLLAMGDADRVHREHVHYFLTLAERAQSELNGPDQVGWLSRLEQEHENLRAALQSARDADDIELGLRLAGSLWPFWLAHNQFEEARAWLDEFLLPSESRAVTPRARAFALLAEGTLIGIRGDNERSILRLREALMLAKQTGAENCAASALHVLGATECARGNYVVAERLLEESLSIYRGLADAPGLCTVLSSRAGVARYQGDYERATGLYEEALTLSRAIEDVRRAAEVLARLGNMKTEQGRPSESPPFYEEALTLCRQLGDSRGVADVLERSGETATSIGDYAGAMVLYEESLALYRSIGTRYGVAYTLLNQSEAATGLGDFARARALAETSLALFQEIDDRRCTGFALMHLGDVARLQGDLERALVLYADSLTMHMDLKTRPQIARCLERIACLCAIRGSQESAAQLHGAAAALRESMDSTPTPTERGFHDECMAMVRARLGDEKLAAHKADGRAMNLAQAVDSALAVARRA